MKCKHAEVVGNTTLHYHCNKYNEDCPCLGNRDNDKCLDGEATKV